MTAGRRAGWPRDAGTTLVELAVSIAVLGAVSQLVGVMLVSVYRTSTRAAGERAGGDDVQVAMERFTRDIRMARMLDTANPTTVTMWVDGDDNLVRSPGETVTWSWSSSHARLTRSTDDGRTQDAGRPSLTGAAFTYLPSASAANAVQVTFTFSTGPIGGITQRPLTTTVRLRNRP